MVRARDRGDLPEGTDPDAAVAALYGAMWYRLLLDEPLDTAYAAALTRLVAGS